MICGVGSYIIIYRVTKELNRKKITEFHLINKIINYTLLFSITIHQILRQNILLYLINFLFITFPNQYTPTLSRSSFVAFPPPILAAIYPPILSRRPRCSSATGYTMKIYPFRYNLALLHRRLSLRQDISSDVASSTPRALKKVGQSLSRLPLSLSRSFYFLLQILVSEPLRARRTVHNCGVGTEQFRRRSFRSLDRDRDEISKLRFSFPT